MDIVMMLCLLFKNLMFWTLNNDTDQPICRAGIEMQTQRTDMQTQWAKERVGRTGRFGLTYIHTAAAAAAKSLQSCPTLCNPIDRSPPGSSVPGILQARTLEWIAIFFSNAWKWKVKVKSLSCARLVATPWTTAYQAPPSLGFSRQEYWSGVPLPSPYIHTTMCKIVNIVK